MKLKARTREPQTQTYKQDGLLLFLDCLNTDIEVAENVTSFFVRRCVYFTFFGKSAWLISSGTSLIGYTGPDKPPSLMFVKSNAPLAEMSAPDNHLSDNKLPRKRPE